MDRKIITAITLAILFTSFGIISFLVVISKRHPWFVEKKLRIGALILSLSGAAVGCNTTSCYVSVGPNEIILDHMLMSGDSATIKNDGTDTITGKIYSREGDIFSYAILNSSDQIITKADIVPVDGTFDESTEEFSIKLDKTFSPGEYKLNFYEFPADSIESNYFLHSYIFHIR